eukprot:TRINITY_DN48_c0_g1_i17.p1 TRINITY_DN48_c0_g1~~TRINITY_DN48_c0_g1_i17.p1  ORF type:complete len:121 (+),score=15.30 TRINITY_DN48_c0_g1_i17:757-1119(+)
MTVSRTHTDNAPGCLVLHAHFPPFFFFFFFFFFKKKKKKKKKKTHGWKRDTSRPLCYHFAFLPPSSLCPDSQKPAWLLVALWVRLDTYLSSILLVAFFSFVSFCKSLEPTPLLTCSKHAP